MEDTISFLHKYNNERLKGYLQNSIYWNKTLFEHNDDALFATDLDGYCIWLNQSCKKITGYSSEEASQLSIFSLVKDFDLERVKRYFDKTVEGNFQNFDCAIMDKSSETVHINITFIPISVKDEIVGVYVVAKDITEIKRNRKRLQTGEEFYRILAEKSLDIITKVDINGNFLYVSPAVQTILGYSPEEILGIPGFNLVHPEDLTQAIEGNETVKNGRCIGHNTYRIRMSDGNYKWMDVQCIPLLDIETNSVYEILSVLRDITELKNNEKKTQDLIIRSEKLSIAGQLAAGIAHEVRNPLTAIKGFLQLIKSNHKSEEAYFDIINSEIDRVEGILSELLTLAKPKSLKFERKRLDLLLDQVSALISTQCIMQNIIINKINNQEVLEINCDENQLKQVFINLLKNSIEAMPNGGMITIEVEELSDKKARVRFIDQGNGIPEEVINRIGEPFFTTKENGTGLGLMISKEIIERHNGKMNIESCENGTNIEVILPLFYNQNT